MTDYLKDHLSRHPTLRTCSSATILRAIKELTQENLYATIYSYTCFFKTLNIKHFVAYFLNKCNKKPILKQKLMIIDMAM